MRFRITKEGHDQETRQAAREVWPDGIVLIDDEAAFMAKLHEFADLAMIDNQATWLANVVLKGFRLTQYNAWDDKQWLKLVRVPQVYDRTGDAKVMAEHQELCGHRLFVMLAKLAKKKPKKTKWWVRNRDHAAHVRKLNALRSQTS